MFRPYAILFTFLLALATIGAYAFGVANAQDLKPPRFEVTQVRTVVAPYSDNWLSVMVGVKNNGPRVSTLVLDVYSFDIDGNVLAIGGCTVADLPTSATRFCEATLARNYIEDKIVAVPGPFLD